jgi:hypothetical protein
VSSLRDQVKIVAMGCTHHGAAGADEKLAAFWYDRVLNSPNTYVIFGGDMVDSIHEKDRRYAEQEVAGWCIGTPANRKRWGGTLIDRQFRYAMEKWRPLAEAGKILWLHTGNHEEKLVASASRDLTLDWSRELNVPYAGLAALSRLTVQRAGGSSYGVSFFTQHGGGGAQTDGAVMNKATALLSGYDVDVALMWHLHKKAHMTKRMLGITDTGRRRIRDRVGAVCGAFLDGHCEGIVSYAELKGYLPTALGPVVIHMKREIGNIPKGDPQRASGYTRIWISDAITEE